MEPDTLVYSSLDHWNKIIKMLSSFKRDDLKQMVICIMMVAFIYELSQISDTCLGGKRTKDSHV